MTKPQEVLKFKRKRLTKEEVEQICENHVREVGRPSPMDDPEYQKMVCLQVEQLGTEGKSPHEISREIGVDLRTLIHWSEKFPEFRISMMRAKQLEQGWWEEQARISLRERNFNSALWWKAAIGRFKDYREIHQVSKTEISGKDGGPIGVNHITLMDTARRVMAILEDAEEMKKTIDVEAAELLPAPTSEDEE